jgi:sugar/nucleoside kinase (ribokinase family)
MTGSHIHGPGGADVLVVGHVTRDRIVIDDAPVREQPGGSAFYAACAHARLGLATALLTRMSGRDRAELLRPLADLGVRLAVRSAQATTAFENVYRHGVRTQKVTRLAPPIQPADFQALNATAIQLGPLTAGDIPPATIAAARARCRWLALDLQGLLRRLASGHIRPSRALETSLLRQADIVKADRHEARLVTGLADPRAAARRIALWCQGEGIVTLARDGALVAVGERVYDIPPVDAGPAIDTTGCGDSFVAAYLARRLRGDAPPVAGRFATAVASLKATRHGPFDADEASVRELLQRHDGT